MGDPQVTQRQVTRVAGGALAPGEDAVAVERALEIRVGGRALSVTLRTPGHDAELATGFLAGEGLISTAADVTDARVVPSACSDQPDAIELTLAPTVRVDWTRLERHFAATAACGLCGRAHLESLRVACSAPRNPSVARAPCTRPGSSIPTGRCASAARTSAVTTRWTRWRAGWWGRGAIRRTPGSCG